MLIATVAAVIALMPQDASPIQLTQEIRALEQKLQDQTRSYERLSKQQGRAAYARDKYRQMASTRADLNEKRKQLEQLSASAQNDAMARQSDALLQRSEQARKARQDEEAALLAKGAKKALNVVVGTSLKNYLDFQVAYTGTSGGVAYCRFNASASGVEIPRAAREHDMEFLLVVDTNTGKVIGVALVAERYSETITDTALNAARQKCVKVSKDILNHFDGVTAEGIEISVRGGLGEIFRGRTWVSYTDPEMYRNAVQQGGQNSGF